MSCPFKIKDYLYVTVNEKGEVGSIYFPNGRIRLVHGHGPQAVELKSVTRYLKQGALQQIITDEILPKTIDGAKAKSKEKYALYEEYPDPKNPGNRKHTSRGVPFKLPLSIDDAILEAAYNQITQNAALSQIQKAKNKQLTPAELQTISDANKAIYDLLKAHIPGIHANFEGKGW